MRLYEVWNKTQPRDRFLVAARYVKAAKRTLLLYMNDAAGIIRWEYKDLLHQEIDVPVPGFVLKHHQLASVPNVALFSLE